MKLKPVNVIEIVLFIVAIAAHFLLKQHIPFMGLLSVLSIAVLSMLYFYGGAFIFASPGISRITLVVYGMAFGAALIGILFYMQKWPFANVEMGFATAMFLILAIIRLIAVFILKKNNVLQYNKGIAIRYALLLTFMLCAFLSYAIK